ncbi:hypothetical protein A2U01_0113218, partial [Trifolium medium]|nr:hypothetical protein [Trifolium medium]
DIKAGYELKLEKLAKEKEEK